MRCLLCREAFAICEPTVQVEGGELCESCDAGFSEPFRPSLGGVVAFLRSDLFFSGPHEFGRVSKADDGPLFDEVK